MRNDIRQRLIFPVIILLTQLFSAGCIPPSISLLSEQSMGDQPVIKVTYDDKYYNCFYVYSVDDLNAILFEEDIVKVKVELNDGTKLVGHKVSIENNSVILRDLENNARVVELTSVRRFVPYKEVAGSKRLEYLFGIVGGCALLGAVSGSEELKISPEGMAIGAAVGAVIGAPLYLRKSEAQEQILNLYNKEVSEKTKKGW